MFGLWLCQIKGFSLKKYFVYGKKKKRVGYETSLFLHLFNFFSYFICFFSKHLHPVKKTSKLTLLLGVFVLKCNVLECS